MSRSAQLAGIQPSEDDAHAREVHALFHAHVERVWRTLHYLGVPEADVPDVCQEVFLVVHRRLGTFEGRGSISTWIHGICVHTASDYRKKAYRRREQPGELPVMTAEASQHQRVAHREELDALRAAIEALPEKQREVFVLYEIEQLQMKEVAEALGCPIQTAYSRLRAARQEVRRCFEASPQGEVA